jgi:hypothetical protein
MLALFFNHPPMFVAGEIALGLSVTMFIGALVVAIAEKAAAAPQTREPVAQAHR